MVWEAAPLGCCPSKEQRAFASSWLPARLSHAHERLRDGWPGAALVQAAPFCSAAGRVLQVSGVALAQPSPLFSGRGCAWDAV